jgi:diguanylate cyclase (GGDEF)-like protein
LDGLKTINDTYGHSEGDAALLELADILRITFREPDIIGRLGGDEFAVLAVGAAEANATSITQRLEHKIEERNLRSRKPYKLQMSTGVVHFDPAAPCSIEDLLSRADIIMYQHKKVKK